MAARFGAKAVAFAGEERRQAVGTSPFEARVTTGFLAAARSSALRCSLRFSASSSRCIRRRACSAAAARSSSRCLRKIAAFSSASRLAASAAAAASSSSWRIRSASAIRSAR